MTAQKNTVAGVVIAINGGAAVPGNIFQPIGDEALVMRKVRQLRETVGVDQVFVVCDVEEIKPAIEDAGAVFLQLAKDADPVELAAAAIEDDVLVFAAPESPFVGPADYALAIANFCAIDLDTYADDARPDHIAAATTIDGRNHNHQGDAARVFHENGAIYVRARDDVRADGMMHGRRALLQLMDEFKGWRIDAIWRLDVVKHLIAKGYAV